jgi:hypothetical protein
MTMRWRAGMAAGLAAVLATVAAPQAFGALSLSSSFGASDEGWTVTQGPTSPTTPGYDSGAITFTDTDSEPLAQGLFVSPGGWSGDGTDNYGGTLEFDLKSSATWGTTSASALLLKNNPAGPEDAICFVDSTQVNTSSQTFQFTLDSTEALAGFCGDPAGIGQIANVMGDLGQVFIVADDEGLSGETTHLDNVALSGGGPPPPFDVARELSIGYQKVDSPFLNPFWAFTGNLTGDEDSCIEGRKVIFFRKQKGPDEKLGARTTGAGGTYRFAYDKRKGTYYALSREVDLGVPTCLEAMSDTFKVG